MSVPTCVTVHIYLDGDGSMTSTAQHVFNALETKPGMHMVVTQARVVSPDAMKRGAKRDLGLAEVFALLGWKY